MHLNMHHDMPDISLSGIIRWIKKVPVKVRPIKIIFITANVDVLIKLTDIDLEIAVIEIICKIHQMRQNNVVFGDRGLFPKLSVSCAKSFLALFDLSADEIR